MAQEGIYFEANFEECYKAIRTVSKELGKVLRRDLTVMCKEVALEARRDVPSGMQKRGRTGVGWGFMGSKGAYVRAGGRSAPKSWVGAYVGGSKHKATFRHPVFPSTSGQGNNTDRKKWTWVDQPTRDFLTPVFDRHRAEIIVKSNASLQQMIDIVTRSGG